MKKFLSLALLLSAYCVNAGETPFGVKFSFGGSGLEVNGVSVTMSECVESASLIALAIHRNGDEITLSKSARIAAESGAGMALSRRIYSLLKRIPGADSVPDEVLRVASALSAAGGVYVGKAALNKATGKVSGWETKLFAKSDTNN